jgi:site-specific recombinase XerD
MSGRYESESKLEEVIKVKLNELPPIVTDYYYSMIASGKSYTTTYEYVKGIARFIEAIDAKENKDKFYINVTETDINKYLAALRSKSKNGKPVSTSDSYKCSQWTILKSFFKFLMPKYMSHNPMEYIERPRNKDNPDVTFLTQEEIAKVIANIKASTNKRTINRDLCIFKLGVAVGLRISAIVQINIEDVEFNNNRIRVTEKGDKTYYVLIGENLKEQIRLWLQDREMYFGTADTDALFISQQNNRLSVDAVEYCLKKYGKGIDKKITPHVMRHTCATNLYEATGDIYLCAQQLHHSDVKVTQRYAEISQAKKKQATSILDNLI